MQLSLPIRGTEVLLDELLQLQLLVADLAMLRGTRSHSMRIGEQRSVFKGQGREFAELKQYGAGDDARQIDWRQTARKQTAYVRVMEEDRHSEQAIWLDLSASSYFGTRNCFKSVMACHWAAFLIWRFRHLHHPVRMFIRAGNHWHRELKVLNQSQAAKACETIVEAHQYLADNFSILGQNEGGSILHWQGRPNLWFISDFVQTIPEQLEQELPVALFSSVSLLQTADPFDADLPEAGALPVSHAGEPAWIETSDNKLQRAYSDAAQLRQQWLENFAWQRRGVFRSHSNNSFQWQEVLSWPIYH